MREILKDTGLLVVLSVLLVGLLAGGAMMVTAEEDPDPVDGFEVDSETVNVSNETEMVYADVELNESAEEDVVVSFYVDDESGTEISEETVEIEAGDEDVIEYLEINVTEDVDDLEETEEWTGTVFTDTEDDADDLEVLEIGTIDSHSGVLPPTIAGYQTSTVLVVLAVIAGVLYVRD